MLWFIIKTKSANLREVSLGASSTFSFPKETQESITHTSILILDYLCNRKDNHAYFHRIALEEVLEEDIFFDYLEYSNLLEESEW